MARNSENPVEGWYPDPEKSGNIRKWNGSAWTNESKPAPQEVQRVLSPPSGLPVETIETVESVKSVEAKKIDTNKVVNLATATGIGVAGAALMADGAIGLGKKRKGFAGIGALLITGASIWLMSVVVVIVSLGQMITGVTPVTTNGVVTSVMTDQSNRCIPTVAFVADGKQTTYRPEKFQTCTWEEGSEVIISYTQGSGGTDAQLGTMSPPAVGLLGSLLMGFIGLFIALIGILRLAVRAGSVAGGFLLLRHGFRMGKKELGVEGEATEAGSASAAATATAD